MPILAVRNNIVMRIVRWMRAYLKNSSAASAVEFVLVFPWFIFFVLVIIEIGLFFYTTSTVEQAVHNYSRIVAELDQRGRTRDHRRAIEEEILSFVGRGLVNSFRFELGYARPDSNFTKQLTMNWVDPKFLEDRQTPFYLRVVVQRPSFVYGVFRPLWALIGDPAIGGIFSPIDVLIVNPFRLVNE